MCTVACTYDALQRNPVRDASPVSSKPKKKPRSLSTMAEVRQLRAMVTYDNKAIARDLPDFIDMMLATSLRVGEAAAIRWSSIDLHAGTVQSATASWFEPGGASSSAPPNPASYLPGRCSCRPGASRCSNDVANADPTATLCSKPQRAVYAIRQIHPPTSRTHSQPPAMNG